MNFENENLDKFIDEKKENIKNQNIKNQNIEDQNIEDQNIEDLIKTIADAEYVFIGIGEEWKLSKHFSKVKGQDNKKELYTSDEAGFLREIFEKQFTTQVTNKEGSPLVIQDAYLNLLNLISSKNYYVISMVNDSYMEQLGFDPEKIVQPCGNQKWLQCSNGCNDILYDVDAFNDLLNNYQNLLSTESELEIFAAKQKLPKCEVCGKELVFNNVEATRYLEKGYLKNWENYTMWMQKTLNRKVCMLELGVSLAYPTVIRWPFEKIAFFNQKSKLFRINGTLFQLSEEIAEKSVSIKQNSVDLFANIFV